MFFDGTMDDRDAESEFTQNDISFSKSLWTRK